MPADFLVKKSGTVFSGIRRTRIIQNRHTCLDKFIILLGVLRPSCPPLSTPLSLDWSQFKLVILTSLNVIINAHVAYAFLVALCGGDVSTLHRF